MKLIIVRHGETEENVKEIHQGHMPGNLSKEGKEQTKKLALRLKDEKIDVIYSSDLKRAIDTTKEIIKFHKNVKVFYTDKLREIHAGSFTGKTYKETKGLKFPEDSETIDQLYVRGKNFLNEIYKKNKNSTVLIVGHGMLNRAFVSVIMNKPAIYIREQETPGPTSVNVFEINENKKHKIHLLNSTEHLK
ncbi:MAG: histidine phosphatase family protein [Nanoarchaeota archaeon]